MFAVIIGLDEEIEVTCWFPKETQAYRSLASVIYVAARQDVLAVAVVIQCLKRNARRQRGCERSTQCAVRLDLTLREDQLGADQIVEHDPDGHVVGDREVVGRLVLRLLLLVSDLPGDRDELPADQAGYDQLGGLRA